MHVTMTRSTTSSAAAAAATTVASRSPLRMAVAVLILVVTTGATPASAFVTQQKQLLTAWSPQPTIITTTTTTTAAAPSRMRRRRFHSSSLAMATVLDDESTAQAASVKTATEDSNIDLMESSSSSSSSSAPFFFSSISRSSSTSNSSPLLDKIQEKIGTVDDERIVFPEYDNGQVPRLYSSLQYNRNNNVDDSQNIVATHRTGSVLGAASLIGGTMVGAGILALPTATAPVGFLPSTAAMGIGWFYMTMSGLLIAELCLNQLGLTGKPGLGMLQLYRDSLGPKWSQIGNITYFFLHYTLLVAYMAQGGNNLQSLVSTSSLPTTIPPQLIFATVCAGGLYTATPAMVEKVNNIMVFVLSAAFLGIIGLGAQSADFSSLVDLSNQHPDKVADAFPIIFLSLVYHNVVPTVVNQLEGDRTKITTAIIAGTTIPTLMFLAWNAVVLGNIDPSSASSIDPVALLQSSTDNPVLSTLVSTFSSLALVTSLIGFVYGLIDGWTDVFDLPTEGPKFEQYKAPLFGLVFLPPLALSMTNPEIFYKSLEIGGAFGVSTLFLVLPPVMVWNQRYGEQQQPLMTKPMVPLGKIPLGSMWKAAATLILEQGADKLGVFDFIKEQLS